MNHPTGRATPWVALVLRWGSYLSALLLAVGVGWVMLEPDVPVQAGPPMPLRALGRQLAQRNPYAWMQVGLLLLLVTPLVRLLMGSVSHWLRAQRAYALVSLAALALILLSILLAGGG